MSKGSCEAAESTVGAALRMARLNCYILLKAVAGLPHDLVDNPSFQG